MPNAFARCKDLRQIALIFPENLPQAYLRMGLQAHPVCLSLPQVGLPRHIIDLICTG